MARLPEPSKKTNRAKPRQSMKEQSPMLETGPGIGTDAKEEP
jgi:hypothetical protein